MPRLLGLLAALVLSALPPFIVPAHADHPNNRPAFAEVVRVNATIAEVAVGDRRFSTLVAAPGAANLLSALQGPGPFTVFAPTNDAFANIPPGLLNGILADTALLTSVLTYHVAPGVRDLRQAFETHDFATLQGQRVYVERDRFTLRVNNAKVQGAAVRASNGVIYVIDSVLLPQFR